MSQEALIAGLKFAERYDLTHKEVEILVKILEKPYTADALAAELSKNVTTVYHLIQRLKLKNLVVLKDKDNKGTNIYQFNESSME